MEPTCGKCPLYNREKGTCRVAVLIEGEQHHLPVFPEDKCHMLALGFPVEQVRWWEETHPDGKKVVKIEYPEDFFGKR